MERLTVKEMMKSLIDEDPNAFVAIENNGYPQTITQLNTEGWTSGTFLMKKEPRLQDEYFCEDEILEEEKPNYIKVLVLGEIISKDELEQLVTVEI